MRQSGCGYKQVLPRPRAEHRETTKLAIRSEPLRMAPLGCCFALQRQRRTAAGRALKIPCPSRAPGPKAAHTPAGTPAAGGAAPRDMAADVAVSAPRQTELRPPMLNRLPFPSGLPGELLNRHTRLMQRRSEIPGHVRAPKNHHAECTAARNCSYPPLAMAFISDSIALRSSSAVWSTPPMRDARIPSHCW